MPVPQQFSGPVTHRDRACRLTAMGRIGRCTNDCSTPTATNKPHQRHSRTGAAAAAQCSDRADRWTRAGGARAASRARAVEPFKPVPTRPGCDGKRAGRGRAARPVRRARTVERRCRRAGLRRAGRCAIGTVERARRRSGREPGAQPRWRFRAMLAHPASRVRQVGPPTRRRPLLVGAVPRLRVGRDRDRPAPLRPGRQLDARPGPRRRRSHRTRPSERSPSNPRRSPQAQPGSGSR